jgi:hypothetical protein
MKGNKNTKRKSRRKRAKTPEHWENQPEHPLLEDDPGAWKEGWTLNGRMPN